MPGRVDDPVIEHPAGRGDRRRRAEAELGDLAQAFLAVLDQHLPQPERAAAPPPPGGERPCRGAGGGGRERPGRKTPPPPPPPRGGGGGGGGAASERYQCRRLSLVECLLEIGGDIILVLDPERQADIAVG